MKKKREFEKIYNRSLPLFAAEYWYRGERFELPKITENSVYYNPLFVYRKSKETDVYYDVTDYIEEKRPIPNFFLKYPEKFAKIAKEYRNICRKMMQFAKKSKPDDFSKIFKLHLAFWPRLAVIYSLGEKFEKDKSNSIFREAYKLRTETDQADYESGNNLIKLAEKLFPGYKDFVSFLTSREIIKKNLPSFSELQKRRKGYIYFNGRIYSGLSVHDFKKNENTRFLKNSLTIPKHILEGITAAKGNVVGRARVILNLESLNKLKEKEILITAMTTPDYLVAMEKAVAFITDEGGITCHAAIVARELGKPCVIATKIATKVIRSGDLIEVDANSGIVKILERAR